MATKAQKEFELMDDPLTMAVPPKPVKNTEPRVTVFLPRLEDSGEESIAVDQYEHVTISNECGEEPYYILRGEPVDVPVSVFIALKAKYPKL